MRISSPAVKRIKSQGEAHAASSSALAVSAATRVLPLFPFGQELMTEYGKHTVANRALPDYRDGLKPVHRRIIWDGYENSFFASKKPIKAMRWVGDTMGKYHPHGDASVYDAMETMARKIPYPYVDGTISNFGSITDSKAAARYVETRLTRYAERIFLDKRYLDVIPMVPNYDGSEVEPLYLPALLPNLLINGQDGIAVGVRTAHPPVHPELLIKRAAEYMQTKVKLDETHFADDIMFNWAIPCDCLSTVTDVEAWLKNGTGSLKFGPLYDWNAGTRVLTITGMPMPFNWDGIVDKLLNAPEKGKRGFDFTKFVQYADESTSKTATSKTFEIRFKAAVDDRQTEIVDKVLKMFNQSFSTYGSFTNRVTDEDIRFGFSPLPNLLMRWCDYRIDLERRYQRHHFQVLAEEFKKQKLMMFARQHIDLIIQIVKTSPKPAEELVAKLKIDIDQAKAILDLALRQLTRISIHAIQEKMAALSKEAAQAKRIFAQPVPTVVAHLTGPMASAVE